MNAPRQDEPRRDEAWIDRAAALLDRSADDLDGATLSRLNRARQAALAERRGVPRAWVWRTGFAAAAVALFGVAIGIHHRLESAKAPASIEAPLQSGDIDLLTSDDDADLYENLDFYAWLEAHPGEPRG